MVASCSMAKCTSRHILCTVLVALNLCLSAAIVRATASNTSNPAIVTTNVTTSANCTSPGSTVSTSVINSISSTPTSSSDTMTPYFSITPSATSHTVTASSSADGSGSGSGSGENLFDSSITMVTSTTISPATSAPVQSSSSLQDPVPTSSLILTPTQSTPSPTLPQGTQPPELWAAVGISGAVLLVLMLITLILCICVLHKSHSNRSHGIAKLNSLPQRRKTSSSSNNKLIECIVLEEVTNGRKRVEEDPLFDRECIKMSFNSEADHLFVAIFTLLLY